MQSSSPSSRPGTMSQRQSYESRIADLKLKRSASHWVSPDGQPVNFDNGEPHSTDNDSLSPDKAENTRRSAMNVFKDLKVGQAGLIWGSDGTLLGKVQDDGLADPEELEGYTLNEKGEILDEDGLKIGQALAHATYTDTRVRGSREHSFYQIKPDQHGWYHCPFAALEVCWYRPQKSKSNFELVISEDLSVHYC